MRSEDPFRSARLKIERAHQLADELGRLLDAYRGAELVTEAQEGKPGFVSVRVRLSEQPPDHVQTIMGDAFHNLRSALDHMAVALARINGRGVSGVYFPFAENSEALEGAIASKKFDHASPEAVDMVRSLEPFRGGNHALRALHDFNVADKHKDFVPQLSAIRMPEVRLGGGNIIIGQGGMTVPFRDGALFIECPEWMGPPLGTRTPLKLLARFPETGALSLRLVVPTLHELAEMVNGVVGSFAALYAR